MNNLQNIVITPMNIIVEYTIGHLLILGLFFCFRECVREKVGKKYGTGGGFWLFEPICVIILSSYLLYKTFTLKHQHCFFHFNCYASGGDGLLYSDELEYETYNECSDTATFSYDIDDYEIKNLDEDFPCEETEFGCCSLHNRCQTSNEYNFTYNDYWDIYLENNERGVIQLGFKKNDKEGSNCPTYNDIFELRELNEINKPIYFYLCIFNGVMMYFCFILCLNCYSKDEHDFSPVNEEEVKKLASV